MADVNGAASLSPGIGIFNATGNTSETADAILLIGEGILDAVAVNEINGDMTMTGVGILSASGNSYVNGVAANLNSIAIFSATAVITSDSDGIMMLGCAALYAKPAFPSNAKMNLVGEGYLYAVPNMTVTGSIELIGKGKSLNDCYIANVEAFFNEMVETLNQTPIVPCYHVHVNRILDKEECNAKMLKAPICYPPEPVEVCGTTFFNLIKESEGGTWGTHGANGTTFGTITLVSGGGFTLNSFTWELQEGSARVAWNIDAASDCEGQLCIFSDGNHVYTIDLDGSSNYQHQTNTPRMWFSEYNDGDTLNIELRLNDCPGNPG